jgi:hypothetical protein
MKLKILNINKFPFKLSNNLLLNIKKLIKYYKSEYIIKSNNISFKFKIKINKNVFSNNIESYFIEIYKNEDNKVNKDIERIGQIYIRIFKYSLLDINLLELKINEIKLIISFLKKIYIKKLYYTGYMYNTDIVNKINRYYSLGFRYNNEYTLKDKFIKTLNKINKIDYNDFIKPYKKLYNIVNSINDISIIKTNDNLIITDYYEKKKLLNELFINMTILLSNNNNILLFKEKGAIQFINDLYNSYYNSNYIRNNIAYIKYKNTKIKFNKYINILFNIIKPNNYEINNLCLILHK